MNCRACLSGKTKVFLYLGPMPLINRFLGSNDETEKYYPLNVMKCDSCHMVQLDYTVDPEEMFRDYTYTPSSSLTMREHFKGLAEKAFMMSDKKDPFIVEIASNDGTLLENFKGKTKNILGVEPAKNIAKMANDKGIPTMDSFFCIETAEKIISRHGKADIIIGTNVLAHVPDIRGFAKAVKMILADSGFAVFESPYLADFIDKTEFDTVYHEHIFYLSILPLSRLFDEIGLEIFDVLKTNVHGGSVQIFLQHKGKKRNVSKSVAAILKEEKEKKLDRIDTYLAFAERVRKIKINLISLIDKLKSESKTIAAYGAAAKGNVLMNYCGIGPESLDFIVDKNPLKQNKFSPGKRVRVYSTEKLKESTPDYLIILPWNIKQEIIKQESWFSEMGGKFIIAIPEVKVI